MGLLHIDHDAQFLDDVPDLLLELALRVDVEERNLELGGVDGRPRAIHLPRSLCPAPEPPERYCLLICLDSTISIRRNNPRYFLRTHNIPYSFRERL